MTSSSASPMPKKPHEIQFQYDEKLLSSCALSLLARGNNDDKNTARTNRHHDPSRVIVNTNFDDTVIVSPLDEDETEVIATPSDDDQSSNILLQSSREHNHRQGYNDCRVLFEQHAAHYQRPILTKDEIQYWEEIATTTKNWDEEEGEGGGGAALITPRIQAFLQSVLFVHDHNTKYYKSLMEASNSNSNEDDKVNEEQQSDNGVYYHTVTLNRFSDVSVHDLPLLVSMDTTTSVSLPTTTPATTTNEVLDFVSLHNEQEIYNIGQKLGRLWSSSSNNYNIQQQHQQTAATTTTTTTTSNIFDSWWWLGDDHNHYFSFLPLWPGWEATTRRRG
jgi:hypothetical protein